MEARHKRVLQEKRVSETLLELELNIHGALQIASFYITYTVKLSYKSSRKLLRAEAGSLASFYAASSLAAPSRKVDNVYKYACVKCKQFKRVLRLFMTIWALPKFTHALLKLGARALSATFTPYLHEDL